ncbi:aldose epimerase family protein [Yoonia sp. R2331]|uniref:aldose epimerase family protein n=1 Tax=Yoonia sp. R2331 TaxID=3237238 RepID=UPI0034E51377
MKHFGTTATGQDVHALTLQDGDLAVTVLTWGATVQDVRLAGIDRSLTLGSDRLSDYEGDMRHHGSLIGPIANRISTARVKIDGMMYELERNQDGRIHLHSGAQATHRRLWQLADHSASHVVLTCDLADGDSGLPGNRTITATFRVSGKTLHLDVTGTTDADTLMNFANHSYWNFDGTPRWDGHVLQVAADRYLPGNADLCPSGEIADVTGTDMDFRTPRAIAPNAPWLDNNFCLSDGPQPLREVLTLTGTSGVGMTVATDQPGIQVYDGREAIRPGGAHYEGLAVEAQGWPDAPNNRAFPSIKVTAETPYRQATTYRFFAPQA